MHLFIIFGFKSGQLKSPPTFSYSSELYFLGSKVCDKSYATIQAHVLSGDYFSINCDFLAAMKTAA